MMMIPNIENKISEAFQKLYDFCEKENYKGYDPYDGLNSRFFQSLPIVRTNWLARLIWIQAFKRLPINLRPLLGVAKDDNPKALGLFLAAYCALYKKQKEAIYLEKIQFFIEKILLSATPGFSGYCWGYNFDWQARAFFQPKYTPTVVASTFVANALLDAYDILGDEKLLTVTRSTCDFILKDLNRTPDGKGNFAFSYSPLDHSVVYNASLLGCRLLARVYAYTGEEKLKAIARKPIVFCCDQQQDDGAWTYGTYSFHQWIDNFHTGYNLECISDYMRFTGDIDFRETIKKGFDYYIHTFFTEEGIPKYYSNSLYPIDIHTSSQLLITLIKLDQFENYKPLVDKVLNWTIDHMQSPRGYFYYQRKRYFNSKIPYMRWAQAWMFLAFSLYELQTCQTDQSYHNV